MNPLLVALMMHFLESPATLLENTRPVYVVPAEAFGTHAEQPLKLTVAETFGETERRKWESVPGVKASRKLMADLCYPAAYGQFKQELAKMKAGDAQALLAQIGGHHTLARVGVAWCNNSVRKMDILPLRHREFAASEKRVREAAYLEDVQFLRACRGNECEKLVASFTKGVVGVPLEAER